MFEIAIHTSMDPGDPPNHRSLREHDTHDAELPTIEFNRHEWHAVCGGLPHLHVAEQQRTKPTHLAPRTLSSREAIDTFQINPQHHGRSPKRVFQTDARNPHDE